MRIKGMAGKDLRKIIVLAAVAGIIVVFRVFHLGSYLTLSYMKESQERFAALYSGHAVAVIAAYMTVYILVTSVSLPGAAILTIVGGALFGLLTGTVAVSFASTIGATMACAISRFVLRDWVQGKFGGRLKTVNEGIAREGAFYLFTLRLIPVFPFWLVNLVMGLTTMRLGTFYWVSQLGMLPGTIVYVNAGRELAKIHSLSGIVSPGLIISFAALGVFPIAARKFVVLYRAKKQLTRHGG
jgi:uncharacterized membrane protein YdjX (TVP38/TMEM64 family)